MIRSMLVVAGIAVLSASALPCENCRLKDAGYHVGEMTILGNGTIFTWGHVAADGRPLAVGVTLTETALTGLRQDVPEGFPKVPGWEYVLKLPKEVTDKTPLDHVSFDWNPKGHIPPGIYDVPHFDLHFYLMPYEDRLKITAQGEDLERCRKRPDAKYMPAGYIFAPESEEPKMGAHWVDVTTPELNGAPFTHTFIYGSYDGRVVFLEPMVTLGYLQTKPSLVADIKHPEAYHISGYYPTRYSIKYNPERKEYTIALEEFVLREKS